LENGGMSKRGKSEICLLFRGEENHIHVILICTETQRWPEMFLNYKALNISEDMFKKKVTNCTKATELKETGKIIL
jgi:hypothetical protein